MKNRDYYVTRQVLGAAVIALTTLGFFLLQNTASEAASDLMSIRQHYAAGDLVKLFDAVVFNDIDDAVIIKPSEIVVTPVPQNAPGLPYQEEFIRDYNIVLCMAGRGCQQDSSVVYFESKSSNFLTRWGRPLEDWIVMMLGGKEQFRPSVNAYMELVEVGARSVESAQGPRITRTCVSASVGHDRNWQPVPTRSAPRVLVLANFLAPRSDRLQLSECFLSSLLEATGIRAPVADLFVAVNEVAQPGREVDCVMKLMADERIVDGMTRADALLAIEAVQASGISCETLS